MKTYRDTMTDIEKQDLADYLASYEAERAFLRENPYTPFFGQYSPDLIFTDPEDPAGCPDPHYFQGAGQEPPQESQEGRYPLLGAMCAVILFGGFVVAIWVFLAYFLPWMVNCYLNMTGC